MALTPRRHGLNITQVLIGSVALNVAATSIWGVVCHSPDADADAFPANQAVLITDPEAALADAGELGTLATTLKAISDFGRSIGVVVRVAEGAGGTPELIASSLQANVIAGLEKLRLAEQTVGVRPLIIGAPGLDTEAVATAIAVLLPKLGAFGYGAAVGATPAQVKTYRDGFSAQELMLLDKDFWAPDPDGGADITSYSTARAIGLRAWLDREVGYHKTISNVPIPGVTGIKDPRSWDLESADTDMALINGADVTGLIRRDGFRFWGNRTCASDPRYVFESAVRTNQVIRRTIAAGLFPYVDQPLKNSLAIDIIESLNKLFRREAKTGRIIGAEAFLAAGNTADQLAAGKLRLGYKFTPCAPLEDLGIEAEITDEFYGDTFNLAA